MSSSPATTVVVIPVHSAAPTALELVSFRQCFRVLGAHPIRVVAPRGLSLAAYQAAVPDFETVFIDAKWQRSLLAYNQLKTSKYFYNLFAAYDYLLTYELDAFVFSDDVAYWVAQGYDYIGAPWFEGFDEPPENAQLIGVGNSGFSLRNVASVRRALSAVYYRDPQQFDSGRKRKIWAYARMPFNRLANLVGENRTIQESGLFEDQIFSTVVPAHCPDFKVAPVREAMRFSFEVKPEKLYVLNNFALPMGCHAWWRYNLPFWRTHINACGYEV